MKSGGGRVTVTVVARVTVFPATVPEPVIVTV